MPKLKYYSVLMMLVCIGMSAPAEAQCWSWDKNEIPGSPSWSGYPHITFDECIQKLVVAIDRGGTDDIVELWTYDGAVWEMIWAENPIPGWTGVSGLYFDRNLNSLVIIGTYAPGFDDWHCGMFKFIPEHGWERIGEDALLEYTCGGQVAFDTIRNVAVISGVREFPYPYNPIPITLEFDGTAFRKFYDPPDVWLGIEPIAFDPITEKVVFFGIVQSDGDYVTLEYGSGTWNLVSTINHPVINGYRMMGMVYVPDFEGIVAIPEDIRDTKIWIYKASQWQVISAPKQPPGREHGLLGYDSRNRGIILYGGLIDLGNRAGFSTDIWRLCKKSHCRPLSKP